MRTSRLVSSACIVFLPVAGFAGDVDKGWAALTDIFSAPDKPIERDRCDIAATLNYDKYLGRMGDIRDAWLYKDKSVEYYQRRSYQILTVISGKEATLLTQAFFGPHVKTTIPSCRFRLFATDRDKYGNNKRFVMVSWSFNSQVASKVNWAKLDDRQFPELAIDYKFGQEFERRMKQDPPP